MKVLLSLMYAMLLFFSCTDERGNNRLGSNVPVALSGEEKRSFASKRGSTDLVESLYNEQVEKSPELKKLENEISVLHESKNDSTELFFDFDSKNNQYYQSASQHLSSIKDSLLRKLMEAKIENSISAYSKQTSYHKNLMSVLEKKELSLSDVHILLKLSRTLPVIEEYQHKNLPGTAPLKGIIRNYDKTIQQGDDLIKQ